jgi:hypothetical protein
VALDEFDSVALDATVRRTVRIANLLGETAAAVRFGLELKPTGGHPPSNAAATRRLMADPGQWGTEGPAEDAIKEYMSDRQRGDGLVQNSGIAELEFWRAERPPPEEIPDHQYGADLESQAEIVGLLTRVRHHAFTYLCQWERQLTFSVVQENALATVSERVDKLLATRAPDVLDKFNVAFRRLREAAARDSEAEAAEEWSQALTSCRRILKAVVDIVQPVDPARLETAEGHKLTDDAYKNRLVEFLKRTVESNSFRAALIQDGESLYDRFSSVDTIASKGVHAQIAVDEAEFCALRTYLLCGEVLWLSDGA